MYLTTANTLKKVFANVYIIPCNEREVEKVGNNMVIATDSYLTFENEYKFINDNEIVLTDDYCPVDSLIPQK